MRALIAVTALLAIFSVLPREPVPSVPPERTSAAMHPAVRAVLETKMESHAIEMTDLLMLVVLLERDEVAKAAERIASEPKIGRAVDRNDANAGVPPEFLSLQDDLVARADEVSLSARIGTDAEMAKAFGELTAVCVRCHTGYLRPE